MNIWTLWYGPQRHATQRSGDVFSVQCFPTEPLVSLSGLYAAFRNVDLTAQEAPERGKENENENNMQNDLIQEKTELPKLGSVRTIQFVVALRGRIVCKLVSK